MQYNPDRHHRRSIRLRNRDYSQTGAYFITLCAENREHLFGDVVNGEMQLNDLGGIVTDEWHRTPDIRREIGLDAFVVMPNHIHGIVWIHNGETGVGFRRGIRPDAPTTNKPDVPIYVPTLPITIKHGPDARSLGSFVAGFKSITTKRINLLRDAPGMDVWQRNYYERIIRDDDELNRVREYIRDNPRKWSLDSENPNKDVG